MSRHLTFIAILLLACLFISAFAAEADFADYDQPTPASHPIDSTTASVPPTPTNFLDHYKFWNRLTWRDFYFEYAIFSLVGVYYALHTYGRKLNTALAQRWIRANRTLLSAQFSQFGVPSIDGRVVPLSHDGGGIYESYATGRVNIGRLWIEIGMKSRHDVVAWLVETIGGFLFEGFGGGGDTVEIIIEPTGEWEGFVWGIVRKGMMRRLRETRYDLGFTRLAETTSLPPTLAIQTELPEISETIFTPNKPLIKAIEDANKWFQYLIVSDFPQDTPKTAEPLHNLKNRITLVINLPTNEEGLQATNKLLEQVIILVDSLTGKKFRSEITKKLKTTRADAVTRFTKSLAVLEETPSQQEIAQKKRAERDRAERERVAKLSAEEQRKFIEKERRGQAKRGQKVSRK